jgi:hypothetical protein
MSNDTNIKGLAELKAAMGDLPEKIERNLMRGSMRAGLKVIAAKAEGNINSRSGALAESVRVGTRIKAGQITGFVQAGPSKKHKKPWYAAIVHKGAKKHVIKARRAKLLAIGVPQVTHPGAAPNPYLEDALKSEMGAAVAEVASHMRGRLASKHGINVPDPLQEFDE